MKKLTILLACLFGLSLSTHAQSTVVVGQGIMPSGSTLPTTCTPTKANDPDSQVLFYHTTSSGGAIGLYVCSATNTWTDAGGGGVTSFTGDGTIITNSSSTGAVTVTIGSVPLSDVSGAAGTQTAASSNNPIIWNWAQTSNSQSGMTFGETSAATGGTLTSNVANQTNVQISTASGSTATPLSIVQSGVLTADLNVPALQILPTWNTTASVNALLIKTTDTSSGSSSNLIAAFDGAATEFLVSKGGVITANGQVQSTGNAVTLVNSNGTLKVPLNTGPVTIFDNGSGGAFGSSIIYSPSACETNFGPTTLNTGATTTTTGLSCLPANSIIDSVVGRVTTTITGSCTGWEFGDGTTAARFTANNTGLTSGSTSVPNSGSAWTTGIASTTTGMSQVGASAITITCAGGNPTAGAIRVIVYYHKATSPTS